MKNTGYLGIGTAAPNTYLEVNNKAAFTSGGINNVGIFRTFTEATGTESTIRLVNSSSGNVTKGIELSGYSTNAANGQNDFILRAHGGGGSAGALNPRMRLYSGTNKLTIGDAGSGVSGKLELYSEQGATDYTTIFQPGTQTQNVVYTLPVDDGTANQFMTTDGAGLLSWTTGVTACAAAATNYVTKFTSGSVVCNSIIYDNGTNVGIGTTTPGAKTEISAGTSDLLKLTNTTGGAGTKAYIDFLTYTGTGINARIGSVDMGTFNASLAFEVGNSGTTNSTTTTEAMRITNAGNVGIGTTTPGYKLSISNPTAGAIQIQDGTQVNGYVLTSDATGLGTWKKPSVNAAYSILGAGVNIPYNTTTFLYTGTTITLPPGQYAVFVNMLMSTGAATPTNSAFWLRSTFGDLATSTGASADIVGSTLASGGLVGPGQFAMLIGTIIINNTSGANKTYYYLAGNTLTNNNTGSLSLFGGTANGENNIVALQLQ